MSSVEMVGISTVRRQPVKDCNAAVVLARRVCRNYAIPSRPAGVYPIYQFRFLEYSQVHVGPWHPLQCCLQSTVTSVTDVIGAKPIRHRLTRRTSHMFAYPWLTDLRFSPLPPLPSSLTPASPFAIPFLVPPLPDRSLHSRLSDCLCSHLFPPPCRSPQHEYSVAPLKPGQVVVFLDVAVVASHRTSLRLVIVRR